MSYPKLSSNAFVTNPAKTGKSKTNGCVLFLVGTLRSIVVFIPAEQSWLLNATETIITPKACTVQLLAFFPTAVSSDCISVPTDLQCTEEKTERSAVGYSPTGYPCMSEYIQYTRNSNAAVELDFSRRDALQMRIRPNGEGSGKQEGN